VPFGMGSGHARSDGMVHMQDRVWDPHMYISKEEGFHASVQGRDE
jgi:hypothetical protein